MSARHRDWDIQCKVYVGNLGNNASKNELESAFGKYGPLKNVWVARNPPGFAFIEFEDPRDAEDACSHLDGTRVCGSRVRVEMSNGRSRGGRDGGGGGGRDGGRGPPPGRGHRGGKSGHYRSRSRSPMMRGGGGGGRRFSRSRSRSPVRRGGGGGGGGRSRSRSITPPRGRRERAGSRSS